MTSDPFLMASSVPFLILSKAPDNKSSTAKINQHKLLNIELSTNIYSLIISHQLHVSRNMVG